MVDMEKAGRRNGLLDIAYMVVWSVWTRVHYLHWVVFLDMCRFTEIDDDSH